MMKGVLLALSSNRLVLARQNKIGGGIQLQGLEPDIDFALFLLINALGHENWGSSTSKYFELSGISWECTKNVFVAQKVRS